MNYSEEYQRKRMTAEEAASLVKSGDWIDYGAHQSFPALIDRALAHRKEELTDVKIRGLIMNRPLAVVEADPEQEHFTYNSWYTVANERKLVDRGQCFFSPMLFRNLSSYYERFLTVNVAYLAVAPMDEHGYFNLSINTCHLRSVIERADKVILEVNENLPRIFGLGNTVHISEVDGVVEGEHEALVEIPSVPGGEIGDAIAKQIVPRMRDGSCIQLGVGGMPDAIGKEIAASDLKDLGVHSELLVNAYLDMARAGKLTNLGKKGIFCGKSVFGLVYGSKELYDWAASDDASCICPMHYVNDPRVIREIDNFVSINSCIGVDLYGQISSESAGTRHLSGTGGQLDFMTGAYDNPTSQSFIIVASTFTDKKGELHSNIRPSFDGGDIITDPRSQASTIVTEFGMASLAGRTTWERAEALIGIAHPNFREELIAEAEKRGLWRRSNKR